MERKLELNFEYCIMRFTYAKRVMGGKKKKEEGEHRCKMERAKLVRSRVKAGEPEG